MKKNGILNSHVSEVLSKMGHTDMIVIADCGLPIPEETVRIDLSLKIGSPSFMETLEVVFEDLSIEKITLANEITENNPNIEGKIKTLLNCDSIDYIPHEDFKTLTKKAKAVIRTGEATPYANIILHAGVIF